MDRRVPGRDRRDRITYAAMRGDRGIDKEAYLFFGPKLIEIGLSRKDIAEQTDLLILQAALRRLDQLIDDPDSLSIVRYRGDDERLMDLSPIPLLLERKSLVLERIASLTRDQELTELKDAVANVVDSPASITKLNEVLDERFAQWRAEDKALQSQIVDTDEARLKFMRSKVEITREKSAIYRTWFERESIASIVGALLLLALAATLITAMFRGTATTEVITSAFLLILGYFFGQATSKTNKPGKSGNEDSSGD